MIPDLPSSSISRLAAQRPPLRFRAHFTLAGVNGCQPRLFNRPLVANRLSGLPAGAFGSLQWIQLHNLLAAGLDVGGEITGAIFPLDLWFWAGLAVNAL